IEQENLYHIADAWANTNQIPVHYHLPRPNGTDGYAYWSPWGGYVFGLEFPPQNPALGVAVQTYVCPSETEPRVTVVNVWTNFNLTMAMTDYQGVSGTNYTTNDGVLASNRYIKLAHITDGTSNTLLVGERHSSKDLHFGVWFAGCGQYGVGLPEGEEQGGSADIVLGVRELNSQHNGWG